MGGAASAASFDTTLLAPDGGTADLFGYATGMSGNTAIVGAYGDNGRRGAAYLFDTSTGSPIAELEVTGLERDDYFGSSVSVSGDRALVGSFGDDDNGSASGSAYVFDATNGALLRKLTASDAESFDYFGQSVSVSGRTALIGAWGDDDGGESSGSVYVFDTETGNQIFKITAPDAASRDYFGYSVALSGTIALVGSYLDDDMGVSSGSAYLFDTTIGEQIAKLTAPDGARTDQFGRAVAVSGNRAVVGSVRYDDLGSNSGSAYLFDSVTGAFVAKLTAPDGEREDMFGSSVAVVGNTVLVGSEADDDARGGAYLFNAVTGDFIAKIVAPDGVPNDRYGFSVALSDTRALVGAYGQSSLGSDAGAAYLYDLDQGVAPIPLPAGGWLILTALGALFGWRRMS